MLSRRRFTVIALVSVCTTGMLAAGSAPAAAQRVLDDYAAHHPVPIHYDKVVDTRGGKFVGFTTPAINDRGTVAFLGYPAGNGAGAGIYTTTNGRHFKTIVTSNHPKLSSFGPPSLNNWGLVAFRATHHWDGSSNSGVYAGYGPHALAAIATTEGDAPYINFGTYVSVNDGGQVAFHAHQRIGGTGSTGVFLGKLWGRTRAVATTLTHPEFASLSEAPHVNNAGIVVFRGVRTPAEGSTQALLAGRLGGNGAAQIEVLFDNSQPTLLGGFGDAPYLTNGGTLAFGGAIKGRPAGLGVFTSPGDGTFATHATTFVEPFGVLRDPVANVHGLVVFPVIRTADAGGGTAVYATAPGVKRPFPVVESGQRLFGGVVEGVEFFRGLNDRNQVVFQYRLKNGVQGIAVARVGTPRFRN